NHLLSLIDGIMEMAMLDADANALRCERFAPAPIIAHCVDLLRLTAAKAGLDLIVDLPPDLPDVTADQRAFKQIVLNLLSNAIKFTERGTVSVVALADSDQLAIRVEDTGIGIAPDDLLRVGSPFFRPTAAQSHRRDGHGLGLSIVKRLIS